jgi:hypothetical protein
MEREAVAMVTPAAAATLRKVGTSCFVKPDIVDCLHNLAVGPEEALIETNSRLGSPGVSEDLRDTNLQHLRIFSNRFQKNMS